MSQIEIELIYECTLNPTGMTEYGTNLAESNVRKNSNAIRRYPGRWIL